MRRLLHVQLARHQEHGVRGGSRRRSVPTAIGLGLSIAIGVVAAQLTFPGNLGRADPSAAVQGMSELRLLGDPGSHVTAALDFAI